MNKCYYPTPAAAAAGGTYENTKYSVGEVRVALGGSLEAKLRWEPEELDRTRHFCDVGRGCGNKLSSAMTHTS